uniref:Uncharacterized protein n=1 Tax=Clytia hemisphaerica TaxID=252671 RepID=A0A7M5V6U0_9CNID
MEFRKLLLFFLVVSPLQVFSKYFYARHFTLGPNCEFKGYAPGGNKIMVQKIEAPVATMQKGLFAGLAGNMKKGAAGAQHSVMLLKGFGKLANIAPKLGPALGLFGVAFSIVKSFTDPSPQDILDQANKAIAELTEEVNNRLDEMKGYVEEKVIKLEKDLIEREYQSLFRIWSNCLKETTKEKVDECQEDAAKDIMGARPKFAIFWDRVQSNEMFPGYDVKRLEANLLTFRDYVILCFASLSALTASLENEPGKKLDYQRYANDLNYEIDWSVKYVKNAFDIIRRMHIGGNNCKDTFKCTRLKEVWEGWPGAHTQDFRLCSCVFDRADVSTMKCEEKIMIRVDGKTKLPTYQWYYTGKTDRQSGIMQKLEKCGCMNIKGTI